MTINIFSNNAKTTLASSITSSQTTITVAPGTGALFPSPVAGISTFTLTLVSATDSSVYEICTCTLRVVDTLTIVRAREGTVATPFSLNDIAGHFDTAGVMTDLVQSQQFQTNYYKFAVATGTVNALSATLPSTLISLVDGFSFILESTGANTGATTLNLTIGSTIIGILPIVKQGNIPLVAGDIRNAFYTIELIYSSAYNAYIMSNPTENFTASFSTNGYQILPSGLVMQWGTTAPIAAGTSTAVTYPIPFPNSIFGFPQCTIGSDPTVNPSMTMFVPLSVTTTGFTVFNPDIDTGAAAKWFAIGN
jgi:hypothetical protein